MTTSTRRRRGGTPALPLAALAILVLAACGPAGWGRDAPAAPTSAPPGARRQAFLSAYRSGGLALTPIDPHTLAEQPDRPSLHIPDLVYGHFTWRVSGDGSTVAVMQYSDALAQAQDVTVRIIDARTGTERVRFRPPVPIELEQLTADGTRLIGWGPAYRAGPRQRFLWDTADGRLLATLPPLNFAASGYDPTTRRVYGLLVPIPADGGPGSATLVVQEVLSGAELGRVPLPGVRAEQREGAWVQPRVIVSPGGERVAVLHADGQALTLVDAGSLRPLWSKSLTHAAGVADRSPPRPAEGQTLERSDWLLAYSPDGRHLYTYGVESWAVDVGRIAYRPLGLRVIAVAQAAIVAEGGVEQRLEWLTLSPDGKALYTLSARADTQRGGGPYVLRRFDPLSLTVLTEREFASARALKVVYLVERTP